MIVSKYFEGDDTDFQWKQHDSYGKALRLIIGFVYKTHLENTKLEESSKQIISFQDFLSTDHRVIQKFHDHLAAYWRKKHLDKKASSEQNIDEWLSWLSTECDKINKDNQIHALLYSLIAEIGDNEDEKRKLKYLQSYANKTYPLSLGNYRERISLEKIITQVLQMSFVVIFVTVIYSGISFYKELPLFSVVLGGVISLIYIWAFSAALHSLCMQNVFHFLIRLGLIVIVSFAIAFLMSGLENFRTDLIISNIKPIIAVISVITALQIAKQLYYKR